MVNFETIDRQFDALAISPSMAVSPLAGLSTPDTYRSNIGISISSSLVLSNDSRFVNTR